MCIIYSSYIQHLTNKHKERQTTEKSTVGSEAQRRWELFFFFPSASGFLCLLHTLTNYCSEPLRRNADVRPSGSEMEGCFLGGGFSLMSQGGDLPVWGWNSSETSLNQKDKKKRRNAEFWDQSRKRPPRLRPRGQVWAGDDGEQQFVAACGLLKHEH